MNTKISHILVAGKTSKGNLNSQFYMNMAVLLGFILFILWVIFLYPKTFIDIKLVLSLLLVPGLIVTPFIFKRILSICGYEAYRKGYPKYNVIITSAAYFLVTIPVGNSIVTIILFLNYFFAQSEVQTIRTIPYNTGESNSRVTYSTYSHINIEWDDMEKRINIGKKPIESISGKIIKVNLSKGLLGYYIIRGYGFESKE